MSALRLSFNGSQPEELDRYFADLQALLDRHGATTARNANRRAVKVSDIQTEKLLKTTAWSDNTNTFDEVKAGALRFYPRRSGDRAHTIQDLDLVIGHYARVGILSGTDFAITIAASFLLQVPDRQNRMSTQETIKVLFEDFSLSSRHRSGQRLQQKFIDHFPATSTTL